MDDLFRLMTIRSPERADDASAVDLTTQSSYQEQLAGARDNESPRDNMLYVTREYESSERFVRSLDSLNYGNQLTRFREMLAEPNRERVLDFSQLHQFIDQAFDIPAYRMVERESFVDDADRVFDSVVAQFLLPVRSSASLADLADTARAIALLRRAALNQPGAYQDPSSDDAVSARAPRASLADDRFSSNGEAITAPLSMTLLLPPRIFPIYPNQIKPVGIADLLVVKQQLKRYEPGEIEHIENVLVGESRKKTDKHSLTLEKTLVMETERTTETLAEMETKERFSLKHEVENTLKEDVKVQAGVKVTAKFGTNVEVNTNVDTAYSNARSAAVKTATEQAKEVTQRASSKVTERVRQQLTEQTTELFETIDEHGFDNKGGTKNLIGIYQWLNKVYEAQVFNYGKRLLFDIVVPEPAAFLRDAVATEASALPLTEPELFNVSPAQLSPVPGPFYYGDYLSKYAVIGAEAPPPDHITVSGSYAAAKENDDANDNLVDKASLKITAGYVADTATVQCSYNNKKGAEGAGNSGVNVLVGGVVFSAVKDDTPYMKPGPTQTLALREAESVSVAISTWGVRDYGIDLEINCKASDQVLEGWRVKTHAAIMQGYRKQLKDYQDQLAARTFTQAAQARLGSNPETNRRVEATELKKSCLALLTGLDLLSFRGIVEDNSNTATPTPPKHFPRPQQSFSWSAPTSAIEQGRVIRFFEQAFEWEQITYIFYPYFWGRKETWYELALRENDDPLFLDFLKAGAARVVIPVRPGFELDVQYFLMTGGIWRGANLPSIADTDYLPITEEIKAATGAPGDETPEGDPWDIKIPTRLVRLRSDGKLPYWKRLSKTRWEWTPKPEDV